MEVPSSVIRSDFWGFYRRTLQRDGGGLVASPSELRHKYTGGYR